MRQREFIRHVTIRSVSFLMLCTVLIHPVWADQKDARLDDLFSELKSSDDISRARQITSEIWTIWHITSNTQAADKLESGIRAMGEQSLPLAIAAFTDVIELEPEFAEGWNKRATVHYMMGKHESSAEDVKRTLELEPRHFGALAGLGLLFMAQESYGAASKAFEAALQANPHLPGAKQNLKIIEKLIEKQQQSPGQTKI